MVIFSSSKVTPKILEDILGVKKFDYGEAKDKDRIGQVTGLAWTQVGGELLTIEASAFKGKGKILILRIGGSVSSDALFHLSWLSKKNLKRLLSDNKQWFN